MASRFAWSKGHCWNRFSPDTYELRREGEVFAIVQSLKTGGWFSYGMNVRDSWNTSNMPTTLEEAKRDALLRVKAQMRSSDDG